MKIIQEKISCPKTLALIGKIIVSFETGDCFDHLFSKNSPFRIHRPRGIPIGNLTSQLFVNIYLDKLDQFVKNDLKIKYYLRYVDDFVILDQDKKKLCQIKKLITQFLKEKLFLEMHPRKQTIAPVEKGIDFLGYVVFEKFCLLRKSNKEKFRKRLKKMKKALRENRLSKENALASITSWLAHAQHAQTFRLRKRLFGFPATAQDQKSLMNWISSQKKPPSSCQPFPKPFDQFH